MIERMNAAKKMSLPENVRHPKLDFVPSRNKSGRVN